MRHGTLLLTMAALAAAAPAAEAAKLPPSGTLDLGDAPATSAVTWTATEEGGLAGAAVAGVGDFDGDGRRDVAVGEPKRDTAAGKDSGAVHVVLDARAGGALGDAAKVVTIRGASAGDQAGFDVAPAGDVNGDGLADLLVGAPAVGSLGEENGRNGEAYVVFGRTGRAEVDLAAPDFGGFRIAGADTGARLGRAVGTISDLNGDGRGELLVSAPNRDVGDRAGAGSTYVVFGRAAGDVDVATLADAGAGYRIDGPSAGALAGRALDSIGDLNGDGLGEVLLTAPRAGTGTRPKGVAYVVYGRSAPGVLDLAELAGQGYAVTGASTTPGGGASAGRTGDWLGESIAALGDVNGDARPDFAVGAHLADAPSRADAGIAYVLYGKADAAPVDVDALGTGGLRITGVSAADQTGFAVAPAGDFNADGLADVAVGAVFADPLSRPDAGSVSVVYGRPGPPVDLDLAEVGDRGLRIAGAAAGDTTGFAVAAAGDVDGDGGPDLVLGGTSIASDYLTSGRTTKAGRATIVFGAAGKPGEIPGAEITQDPGYLEEVRRGCVPATNVQAVLDDDDYNDERADPGRIRLAGMQTYVATPRNYGTVLGVTGFGTEDEGGEPEPIIEPTQLTAKLVPTLQRSLFRGITGTDEFPGYDEMFRTLANDNPSATARIMVIDGYTFRRLKPLKGLTDGSAPTYIVAIGTPPDRNRTDISEMRRIVRETKGRFYVAKSARRLEKALQDIESRLRCDLEAGDYKEELEPGDEEEVAETLLEEDVHTADVSVTWRDADDDFEIDRIDVLSEDGDDVLRRIDAEDLARAYGRSSRTAAVTAGRGRTFRAVHLRGVRAGTRLRVVVRSANARTAGRVYARVTQSRRRS